MVRVGQGDDLPTARITGSDETIRLLKYGRAIEMSYEVTREMPIDLLQKFLGHTDPATTQIYYEPNRMNVKRSHREAMTGGK